MPQTVEVRFKGTRRAFFQWPHEDTEPLRLSESVIVDADRGEDFGRVSAVGDVAAKKCGGSCSVPATSPGGVPVHAGGGCGPAPVASAEESRQLMQWFAEGRLSVPPVAARFPLERAGEAVATVANGELAGRVIVEVAARG